MRNPMRLVILLFATTVLFHQTTLAAGVKAFTGARIIDGTGTPAIADGVIVVRDGKVEAVGPSNRVKLPKDAEVISLAGKTVIPGLISTHVHISDSHGLTPPAYTEEHTMRQLGVFPR